MRDVRLHGRIAAGRVALVDDEDYELVMRHCWRVLEQKIPGHQVRSYARASAYRDGNRTTIYMHALIAGYPHPDHIDHDGLNNQRANLRRASGSQNMGNQRPRVNKTSRYKGVNWDSHRQRWRAQIMRKNLGRFAIEEEAARAYDAAAVAVWGEFALLNFPEAKAA